MWAIASAGQLLICLVLAQVAARIPLSGMEYQWVSRLVNPQVGWGFGWLIFVWLAIGVAAVDYALAGQALMPLLGITPSVGTTQLITIGILAIQALVIVWSARLVALINGTAVGTELGGLALLALILLGVILFGHHHSWSYLTSRGAIPKHGYWAINGGFMLCLLAAVYTITGFEQGFAVSEETENPTRVVPTAMIRAVVISGVGGMLFLIVATVAIPNLQATSAAASPLAYIMQSQIGSGFEKVFLAFVCISIFACGLCVMMAVSRVVFAMSRDCRFPGYQLFRVVPSATHTPVYATVLIGVVGAAVTLVFSTNTLTNLFTATAILPSIIYFLFLLLYLGIRRRLPPPAPGVFSLGRKEGVIIAGSLLWLVITLTALLFPSVFWAPVKLVGVMVAIGAVFFVIGWLTNRDAFLKEPGAATIDEALARRARRHRLDARTL